MTPWTAAHQASLSFTISQSLHKLMSIESPTSFVDIFDFCWQSITFLPRSKHLFILWLQSPSTVILEPKNIKSATVSTLPTYLPWSDGTICHDLNFWMSAFSLSSFTLIKRFFSSSSIFTVRLVSSTYLRLLIFLLANLNPVCDSFSPAFHMMYFV